MLVKRDGEYCRCCGKLSNEGQLIVDHKDNDNGNNDLNNLQLLCRTCNYLKNPRREPLDIVCEKLEQEAENEIEISKRKEPLFRKYVSRLVADRIEVPQKEIIYSGAEEIRISPVTAKRYLDKMCSSRGIYERINRVSTVLIKFKKDIDPNL